MALLLFTLGLKLMDGAVAYRPTEDLHELYMQMGSHTSELEVNDNGNLNETVNAGVVNPVAFQHRLTSVLQYNIDANWPNAGREVFRDSGSPASMSETEQKIWLVNNAAKDTQFPGMCQMLLLNQGVVAESRKFATFRYKKEPWPSAHPSEIASSDICPPLSDAEALQSGSCKTTATPGHKTRCTIKWAWCGCDLWEMNTSDKFTRRATDNNHFSVAGPSGSSDVFVQTSELFQPLPFRVAMTLLVTWIGVPLHHSIQEILAGVAPFFPDVFPDGAFDYSKTAWDYVGKYYDTWLAAEDWNQDLRDGSDANIAKQRALACKLMGIAPLKDEAEAYLGSLMANIGAAAEAMYGSQAGSKIEGWTKFGPNDQGSGRIGGDEWGPAIRSVMRAKCVTRGAPSCVVDDAGLSNVNLRIVMSAYMNFQMRSCEFLWDLARTITLSASLNP